MYILFTIFQCCHNVPCGVYYIITLNPMFYLFSLYWWFILVLYSLTIWRECNLSKPEGRPRSRYQDTGTLCQYLDVDNIVLALRLLRCNQLLISRWMSGWVERWLAVQEYRRRIRVLPSNLHEVIALVLNIDKARILQHFQAHTKENYQTYCTNNSANHRVVVFPHLQP